MPVAIKYTTRFNQSAAAQSAVALVAADGETITGGGTSQTNFDGNGTGFYARNGLTRAANWSGPNPLGGTFSGFDDPNFVRIAAWLVDFTGTGFYSRALDLGLNGFLPQYTSVDPANNATYGIWSVVVPEQYATQSAVPSGPAASIVGASFGEEPYDDTTYTTIHNDAATWLSPLSSSARFHLYNYTHHLLNPSLWSGTTTGNTAVSGSDPSPPTTRKQVTTCDQYWFASQNGGSNDGTFILTYQLYTHLSSPTADQTGRGSNYGSMLDAIRAQFSGSPTSPIGVWTENGAPFNESYTHEITPDEMEWAVWSTLVHGARNINYFNHTFQAGNLTGGSNNNFNNAYYGGPGVAGNGIYARAKQINLRALAIAPAINAPTDGYFAWGSTSAISRAGFLTAVTSTNSRSAFAGVDASCRWVPGQSKHFILAATREPQATTNIPVTYRMVDQGQTTAVSLVGGSNVTIQRGGAIPNGFCEFSSTFANAAAPQAWRID